MLRALLLSGALLLEHNSDHTLKGLNGSDGGEISDTAPLCPCNLGSGV